MKERLKQYLALRHKQQIFDSKRIPSAIVLPLFYKNNEYWILFIKRTEIVEHHKGQISFPGGRRDPEDRSLLDTALRELDEEIGVPPEAVEILGELDDSLTLTSNYIISPLIGTIPYPYEYKPDTKEIAYLIEIPISALLEKSCLKEEHDFTDGINNTLYYYTYQNEVIWGATARILNQFLEIWVLISNK